MSIKVKTTQSADSQEAPREMIGYQVFNRRTRLSLFYRLKDSTTFIKTQEPVEVGHL
jgi:hypothetical protein